MITTIYNYNNEYSYTSMSELHLCILYRENYILVYIGILSIYRYIK